MSDLTGQGGSPTSGSGGFTPATLATQKPRRSERNTNATIPAGAIAVEIHRVQTDPATDIEVLLEGVSYDGKWHFEAVYNPVDNTWEMVPEVEVISNGLEYWFSVTYPESSPVDPAII